MRIYCEAFSNFWKFTPEKFLIMCSYAVKTGKPVNFSHYGKRLVNAPRNHVYKRRGQTQWSTSTTGTFLFHVTDWRQEDYITAYREVYDVWRRRK